MDGQDFQRLFKTGLYLGDTALNMDGVLRIARIRVLLEVREGLFQQPIVPVIVARRMSSTQSTMVAGKESPSHPVLGRQK